jgi:hypothetical protein
VLEKCPGSVSIYTLHRPLLPAYLKVLKNDYYAFTVQVIRSTCPLQLSGIFDPLSDEGGQGSLDTGFDLSAERSQWIPPSRVHPRDPKAAGKMRASRGNSETDKEKLSLGSYDSYRMLQDLAYQGCIIKSCNTLWPQLTTE